MPLFATFALVAWLPIVVGIFSATKPRRAVVASYVSAWLFLPAIQLPLPGFPDYSKITATTFGVLLGSMIFDPGRLFTFRLRWYDFPMVGLCIAPFITTMANDLGLYDALSVTLQAIILYAFPYWIGRTYLASTDALRDLALGIVVGGLVYVPFCLYEMRFSPVINIKVYGFNSGAQVWEGLRYGGYRPKVFLSHGLECGMWFTMVMLIAYRFWARGVVQRLAGWPFWAVTLVLGVNTVLCKATGALLLLLLGLGILWLAQKTKSAWPVWALILLPPAYVAARTSGVWSGQQLTDLTTQYLGEDRGFSVKTRFYNEVLLMDKAAQRPIFGWGGYGRSRVFDHTGKDIVLTDGLWIITYGANGLFGLTNLFGFFAVPLIVMLRRHPIATWGEPEMVPAASLAIILGLYSADNLSNAIPTPINTLVAGAITGLPAVLPGRRRPSSGRGLEAGDRLAAAGRPHEAASAYREAIAAATLAPGPDSARELAAAQSRLAVALEAGGSPHEAEEARRQALALREGLAEGPGADPRDRRELAEALEDLALGLAGLGRDAEVAGLRRRAVEVRAGLAYASREDYDLWAVGLNDLAWLLATSTDATTRDSRQAVALAQRAATEAPKVASFWNTLGVARYYAGDEAGAVEALGRSIRLGPPGGTAFDLLVLAMALHRLGDAAEAREALARGMAWADRHHPGHPGLARFRAEAQDLLGGVADRRAIAGPS